jgi:hypothetical protein
MAPLLLTLHSTPDMAVVLGTIRETAMSMVDIAVEELDFEIIGLNHAHIVWDGTKTHAMPLLHRNVEEELRAIHRSGKMPVLLRLLAELVKADKGVCGWPPFQLWARPAGPYGAIFIFIIRFDTDDKLGQRHWSAADADMVALEGWNNDTPLMVEVAKGVEDKGSLLSMLYGDCMQIVQEKTRCWRCPACRAALRRPASRSLGP